MKRLMILSLFGLFVANSLQAGCLENIGDRLKDKKSCFAFPFQSFLGRLDQLHGFVMIKCGLDKYNYIPKKVAGYTVQKVYWNINDFHVLSDNNPRKRYRWHTSIVVGASVKSLFNNRKQIQYYAYFDNDSNLDNLGSMKCFSCKNIDPKKIAECEEIIKLLKEKDPDFEAQIKKVYTPRNKFFEVVGKTYDIEQ
ncbi:MAG: hypothetical protein WA432_03065 [Candidatus Babeliaceae bacterium]